jgi:hypothetical protein
VSLPSPEQLEALGYLQLPLQGDCGGDGVPLATYQMALRLRTAEAKLAAIEAHCRKHADHVHLHCPDLGRPPEALVKAEDILAITGTEAEDQERSDEKGAGRGRR